MSFGERLRLRREELGMSRIELAEKLGVSRSAVGNYEIGVSFPKEEVLLRLFDALGVDANYLYRDSFRTRDAEISKEEKGVLERYRRLSLTGRRTVCALLDALGEWQEELEADRGAAEPRVIPLYRSPAAAGYAAPVFGEDFEPLTVTGDVPPKTAANLTLRVNGGDWVSAEGLQLKQGDTLEYRLELYAYNCLRTPRIEKVTIGFDAL